MKIISLERLGVINRQSSLARTLKWIHQQIRDGIAVHQAKNGVELTSSRFPEGHHYSPGTLAIDTDTLPEYVFGEETKDKLDPSDWRKLKLPAALGVYNGLNSAPFCYDPYQSLFELYDLPYVALSDEDIRNGALADIDLLVVPGGPDAGESYYAGLGSKGMDAIRQFVNDGGKYLGSCAGAYLPLTARNQDDPHRRMWLNMVEATDVNGLDYWRTGTGFVRIRINEPCSPHVYGIACGNPSTHDVIYWEGPVFEHLGEGVKVLATYDEFLASGTELPNWPLHDNSCAKEALAWTNPLTRERFNTHMKGRPAAIEAAVGKGRLVLYSFHPEFGTPNVSAWKDSVTHLFILNSIYDLCSI